MTLRNNPVKNPLLAALVCCLFAGFAAPSALAAIADRSAEEYIERALEFQQSRELISGIIELKNAIKIEPNNATAHIILGEIHLELGDLTNATKELERARNLGAPMAEWIAPLAQSWLRLGRFEEVLDLVRVDENFPDEVRAALYTARGDAYRGLSQMSRAQLSFEMALDEDSGHAAAYVGMARLELAQANLAKAEERLAQAIAVARPDDTEVYLLDGDIATEQGDLKRAEAAYRSLADAPLSPVLFQLPLSQTLIRNGRFKEAKERLDDVLSVLPNHTHALHLRATVAHEMADFDLAFDLSSKVLDAAPDHLSAQLVAAAASYSLGNYDTAHLYLTKVLEADQSHRAARRLFGATLMRLGRFDETVNVLQPLADEGDIQALSMIGTASIRGNNAEKGRTYLERYNELRPNDPGVLAQLGMLRLGGGDHDQGMAALAEAIEIDPEHDTATLALFTAHVRDGNIEDALAMARRVQENQPNRATGLAMEGMANDAAGELDAARTSYAKALAVEPGDPATSTNFARFEFREGHVEKGRGILLDALKLNPNHFGMLLTLAQFDKELEDMESAIARLESAVEAEPTALTPRIMLARLYLAEGAPLKALNVTQEMLRTHGENTGLLEVVGEAQLRAEQHNSAANTLRTLVRLRTESARAQHLLAIAYRALGDEQAFEKELRKVPKIDNSYLGAAPELARLLYTRGEDDEAIAMALDALDHLIDDPTLLEVLGRALLRQSRINDALAPLSKLAAGNPENAEAQFLHGQVLSRLDRIEEAINAFRAAIELEPEHHDARLSLARSMVATNEFALASAEIKTLKGALPENSDVLDLEALVIMNQGDLADAITKFQRVLTVEPREDRAIRLSRAQWMAGERDDAVATLVDWLAQNPDDALSRANLADYYLTIGRIDAAGTEYGRLFSRHNGLPSTRNNYAWVLWKQGAIEAARVQAERAFHGAPDDPSIQDTLGIILLSMGDISAALDILSQASEGAPQHPAIAYHFAQALARAGEALKAADVLDRLLASNMEFEERGEAQKLRATLSN